MRGHCSSGNQAVRESPLFQPPLTLASIVSVSLLRGFCLLIDAPLSRAILPNQNGVLYVYDGVNTKTAQHERGLSPMATVYERVRDIIVDQLGVEADEITMEANFRDDLKADSLDLVELIMAFEEEFGGEISDDEAQAIKSVGDAVTYLEKRGE